MTPKMITAYLNHLRARNYSQHTIRAYTRELQQFAAFVSSAHPDSYTRLAITGYLAGIQAAKKSPATEKRALDAIKSALAWLKAEELITSNPAEHIRPPKLRKRLMVVPKAEDICRTLETPAADLDIPWPERARLIVDLLYTCGLRREEVCKTDLADIMDTKLRVHGKRDKERFVPLCGVTRQLIAEYLPTRTSFMQRRQVASQALFLSARGKQTGRMDPRSVGRLVKRWAARFDMPERLIHPHLFRHATGTHMVQNGCEPRLVMELLGHANLATTQIYLDLDQRFVMERHKAAHPRAR